MRRAFARPRLAFLAAVAWVLAPVDAPAQEPAPRSGSQPLAAPSGAEPAEPAAPPDEEPAAPEPPPEEPSPEEDGSKAEPPAETAPQSSAPATQESPPAGSQQRPPEQKPAEAKPPEQKPAEAKPPEQKPAETKPPERKPAEAKPPEQKRKEETWLDVGHAFIEQRIFAPVLRLDRFFSDERSLEAERSRSFLRWRSEIHFAEHDGRPSFTTGVSANLRLPGLNKRLEQLRIVIEGQTRNAVAALFPAEPGTPIPEGEEPIGAAETGLRFRFFETLFSHADVGAGVIVHVPPGVFGRTRFRFVLPVKKLFLTRYIVTGYWRTDTHFGTSGAMEVERPLGRTVVARLSGGGNLNQRSKGIEWVGDLAFLAPFNPYSAIQAGATVNGATRAVPSLDRWRIYTRLRRAFYRRWLFFELEPDISWPWTAELGRHHVWGIAGRLEVQFQGTERPVQPPAAMHEPADPPPESLPAGHPPR